MDIFGRRIVIAGNPNAPEPQPELHTHRDESARAIPTAASAPGIAPGGAVDVDNDGDDSGLSSSRSRVRGQSTSPQLCRSQVGCARDQGRPHQDALCPQKHGREGARPDGLVRRPIDQHAREERPTLAVAVSPFARFRPNSSPAHESQHPCRDTFAKLPGGDARLRSQQRRIADRIAELTAVSQIKHDLDSTHLDDGEESEVKPEPEPYHGSVGGVVKVESGDRELEEATEVKPGRMQDVIENGPSDEATSPSAKRRIAAQVLVRVRATRSAFLPL